MHHDALESSPSSSRGTRFAPLVGLAFLLLVPLACSTPESRIPSTPTPTPAVIPPPSAWRTGGEAQLESVIREEMRANAIPGLAIGIVTREGLAWGAGFGVARRPARAGTTDSASAVTVDTRFPIASVTKPITAFAAVRLAEQGRLDLDAPVSRYLPDFDPPNPWRPITVRDLLSHHAGLVRDYQKGVEGDTADRVDIVDEISGVLLADPPGAAYRYSNVGYSVAGRVLEAVTRQTYEEHVAATVFEPLGMSRSAATIPSPPPADYAVGHESVGLLGRRVRPMNSVQQRESARRRDTAAGAAVSTVRDLASFVAMLLRDGNTSDGTRLIAPDAVASLFVPPYPKRPLDEDDYALGFKMNGLDLPWPDASHGGTLDGYSTLIALVPDRDLGVVVLYNGSQPFSRYIIARKAIELWLDTPLAAPALDAPAVDAPTVDPGAPDPTARRSDADEAPPLSGHFVGVGEFALHIELDVARKRLVLSGEELSLVAERGPGPDRYRIVKRILGIPFSVAGALNAERAHLDFAEIDGRRLPRITLTYRDLPLEMYFLPIPSSTDGTSFATAIPESVFALSEESAVYAPLGPTRIRFTRVDGLTFADLDTGGISRVVLRSVTPAVADAVASGRPAPDWPEGDVYQAQGTGETFRFEGGRLFYSGLWFERIE